MNRNTLSLCRTLLVFSCVCLASWMFAQSPPATTPPSALPAQEQPAAAKSLSTAEALRSFRTIYLHFKTGLIKPAVLAGRLQQHEEFDLWGLSIVNDPAQADVIIEVDHQPGWFYYYYTMTHRQSDLVLAAGKTTDLDGASASRKIGDTIIKRIKRVRPVPEQAQKKAEGANGKD